MWSTPFGKGLPGRGGHRGQAAGLFLALAALAEEQIEDAGQQDYRRDGADTKNRLAGEQAADLEYDQGHHIGKAAHIAEGKAPKWRPPREPSAAGCVGSGNDWADTYRLLFVRPFYIVFYPSDSR